MDLSLRPGSYVLAISGGVDSMALLHQMALRYQEKPKEWKLIVAHFDHGIRDDSIEDRRLVQSVASRFGLPFVYAEGNLGPSANEATARTARYRFLKHVRRASGAQAIVTAHHQDDLLETAVLNLLRGTGRRGVSSMMNDQAVERPFLSLSKQELHDYAQSHHIVWREDSTNQDIRYRRNHIRQNVMTRFSPADRQQLVGHVNDIALVNRQLEEALINVLHQQTRSGTIDRRVYNQLPHNISKELLASWLRSRGLRDFDRRSLERLSITAKVAKPGRLFPVKKGWQLEVHKDYLALRPPER